MDSIKIDRKGLPTASSFIVTDNCNLRCSYCFQGDRVNFKETMSKEVIEKGLDYLSDNAVKVKSEEGFHAMIFGGEPLLYPDKVEHILSYGLKLQEEKQIPFTATIITNATQMSDKIIWLLTEYKSKMQLTCQLSIDGMEESQDLYRVDTKGRGSFKTVESNIESFKMIFKNTPHLLSIHGCINKKTLPFLFENYKFFREDWGIEGIWFMPIHEEDWSLEDVKIYREQLLKIVDFIFDRVNKEKSLQELTNYAPINRCLHPYTKFSRLCGAGDNYITITPEGDYYPCHFYYFNKDKEDMNIGNIYDGMDEENKHRKEFLTYDKKQVDCNTDCENVNCYRCMGTNWLINGDSLKQVKGNYCLMSSVEKEMTDMMKEKIEQLDFIDLEDEKLMKVNKTWVEKDKQHIAYTNAIGEEKVKVRDLNEDEKQEMKQYYEENSIDILAKGLKMCLEEITEVKELLVETNSNKQEE